MKRHLLFSLLLLTFLSPLWAQQGRVVTGTITGRQNNEALESVTVTEKGTPNTVTTGPGGSYTIRLTRNNSTLVYSYVGYGTQEVQVENQSIINLALQSQAVMDEVVVTAFGIKKEKRSLGYTVQNVDAEDLNMNRQNNVVNALQGKVAGVQITSGGGGPGQGARILIRGINSLDAGRNNQPLFIVDGVEIDNSTFTTGGADSRGMTNRAADINPDDIENISVLRGGGGYGTIWHSCCQWRYHHHHQIG